MLPSGPECFDAHKKINKWVVLREGDTIAGREEDRGVFALTDIPPNTKIAPYLGRVRPASTRGPYCLQVNDSEDTVIYLDSLLELYDVGYLVGLSDHQKERTPTPSNFGRYVSGCSCPEIALALLSVQA
jgi:hypothetical protein